jgi:stearoyl-CoA desaturase (delta-9 desaturase)
MASLLLLKTSMYIGLLGVAYAAYYGGTLAQYGISLVMYVCMVVGMTVGMHRYFTHRSYETSKFWQHVLAFFATISLFGSVALFPAFHILHHRHSDTDLDPHITDWTYFFAKRFKHLDVDKRVFIKLLRMPVYSFYHKYYGAIVAAWVLALLAISVEALVFAYLIPLFVIHFVAAIHQTTAHYKQQPRDNRLFDVALLSFGEFLHASHHVDERNPRFGDFDLGYYIIKGIRTDGRN